MVVFPGARPSIGFAQQAYCERGDEIIYPTPGYPLYESYIPYVGARPVPIHLQEDHGFSLTTDELARCDPLVVIPAAARLAAVVFCPAACRSALRGAAAVPRRALAGSGRPVSLARLPQTRMSKKDVEAADLRARAHSDVDQGIDPAVARYLGDLAPAAD